MFCGEFLLTFLFVALCALRKTKRSVNSAFVNPIYGNWNNPEKIEVSGNGELYCFRRGYIHTHIIWTCSHITAKRHALEELSHLGVERSLFL